MQCSSTTTDEFTLKPNAERCQKYTIQPSQIQQFFFKELLQSSHIAFLLQFELLDDDGWWLCLTAVGCSFGGGCPWEGHSHLKAPPERTEVIISQILGLPDMTGFGMFLDFDVLKMIFWCCVLCPFQMIRARRTFGPKDMGRKWMKIANTLEAGHVF